MSQPGGGGKPIKPGFGNKPPTSYANPFRKAQVTPERIDMGVDMQGRTGDPVYAIAPGTIVEADNAWSGAVGAPYPGSFITEHITSGPAAGQNWYLAEDVLPNVRKGQKVNKNTQIATFTGAGQSESGWAVGGNAPGETKAAQYGQQAPGPDPGAWETAFGISGEHLLRALGAKPSPITQAHGTLPKGFYPSKNVPSGGGNNNPPTKTTLTSFFGAIGNLTTLATDFTSADLWERIGLGLLAGILLIVGIIILGQPANQAIEDRLTDSAGSLLGLKSKAGRIAGGSSSANGGPSPEVVADRNRRLALAERNTQIGEAKVSVMQQKESRLALGKRAAKPTVHKSGNPEPNPNPTHS